MEVHYYIEKKEKAEKYQIQMYITDPVFKPRIKHYTGERITPNEWNKKKERGKGTFCNELNAYLDSLEHKANHIRLKLKSEGKFNRDEFILALAGDKTKKKSFWEYYDLWIEECKDTDSSITDEKLSERTITIFRSLKNILMDYEKDRNIRLSGSYFGASFYKDFKKYITDERVNVKTNVAGGSINTFSGHIKNIKKFLSWLSLRDKSVNLEYKAFKKKFVKSDDKPFRNEELASIYDIDFTKYSWIKKIYQTFPNSRNKDKTNIRVKIETLERARLVLLLLCSCGKRISDYNLMTEFEIEGEIIKFKAKKNQVLCYVPYFDDLYFRPVQIITEMNKKFGGLPKVSGQKLNDALKDLFLVMGFDRFIPTSKTGRKTYATLKVKSGVNPEIIMLSTGHKTRASFDHYVTMDEYDVIQANKEKAQYLKAV